MHSLGFTDHNLDGHLAIAQFCSPVLPLLASITVLKL